MQHSRMFCPDKSVKILSQSDIFCPKNLIFNQKRDFRRLRDENGHVTPRGGPARLFGLPWGFTPNRQGSRQKEISDHPHPFIKKIDHRNLKKSTFCGF